jgi:hypothetical protein
VVATQLSRLSAAELFYYHIRQQQVLVVVVEVVEAA